MQAFRQVLHDCYLVNIISKGCAYTWMNHREGEELIKEKLDRALCNLEWQEIYPNTEVLALPALGSDHSPLVLSTDGPSKHRHRSFYFEAFWLQESECREVISKAWTSTHLPRHQLPQRLFKVSAALSRWSKSHFSVPRQQICYLQQQLQSLTNKPNCSNAMQQIQHLKTEIHKLWEQEERFWAMRSRINWLKWGDKNTKFFHATTLQRCQRNRIRMLQSDDNSWVRDENDLKHLLVTYYSTIYQSIGPRNYEAILQQCLPTVTAEMNEHLIAPLTLQEVQCAVFQLGATKAPGPDGLNGLFYQSY